MKDLDILSEKNPQSPSKQKPLYSCKQSTKKFHHQNQMSHCLRFVFSFNVFLLVQHKKKKKQRLPLTKFFQRKKKRTKRIELMAIFCALVRVMIKLRASVQSWTFSIVFARKLMMRSWSFWSQFASFESKKCLTIHQIAAFDFCSSNRGLWVSNLTDSNDDPPQKVVS